MAEGPSTAFKFFRYFVGMLASLLVPLAFGACMSYVPRSVLVFMFVAAGFHLGDHLLTLWMREKYPPRQRVTTEVKEVIFHGEEARNLHEFLQAMSESKPGKENAN